MPEREAQQPKVAASGRDLTGTRVGRFAVRVQLGSGGMGEVYRADDTKLKRPVALKRMGPRVQDDKEGRENFLREAERASSLVDQHIAGVYDVIEEDGEIFLVMEYVEGVTLRHRLREAINIQEFLGVAMQCVQGLTAAHEKEIVHRDIKPENIMLTPAGRVKILDFGVARRLSRTAPIPTAETADIETGRPGGTLAYMAPEVLLERDPDARADIFSLGVVFYEALAGHHPFLADTFMATSDRILHEVPPALNGLKPQVPAELDRIIAKMMAKDPAGRYSSAAEVLSDLHALASWRSPWVWSWRRIRRSALRIPLVALSLIAVAMLIYLALRHWWPQPNFAERDWVLVADFENHSGAAVFDRTLSELVRQALEESRYVNVVPRDQVREAALRAGRTDVKGVDAALGREICQRENYSALLTGEIRAAGGAYLITAQVVDPRKGVAVVTETETIQSPADLYAGVDRLASHLRNHLGESLAQIEKASTPLARVTTPSLEALERYSRAVDFYAAGDLPNFFPLAKSAVEMDPDFAMAHLYLAKAYERMGDDKSTGEELERARKGLHRVTERERYHILAMGYFELEQFEKSAEQYRLLTALYPDDLEGLRGLAQVSVWVGRPEESIQEERRALQLSPHSAFDYLRLMLFLDRVNRPSEVLAVFDEARGRGVELRQLHWPAGLAHLANGDPGRARGEFELLSQAGGTYQENLAELCAARVLIYEGRMREAVEALRAGLVLDERQQSQSWVPVRHYLLARAHLDQGNLGAARQEAAQLAKAAQDVPSPENFTRAGLVALELGDLQQARRLLSQLKGLVSKQGSAYAQTNFYNLKGALEMAEGKNDQAVESQRRALLLLANAWPHLSLGDALSAQADWAGAVREYGQFLEFKGEVLQDDFAGVWVSAHLRLARALARNGNTAEALRRYDEFLRVWSAADSNLPTLRQARNEREKLASASSPSAQGTKDRT